MCYNLCNEEKNAILQLQTLCVSVCACVHTRVHIYVWCVYIHACAQAQVYVQSRS